jgi:Tfp pilus assembly protein PilF
MTSCRVLKTGIVTMLCAGTIVGTACRRDGTATPTGPREAAVRAAAQGVTRLMSSDPRGAAEFFRKAIQSDQSYATARVLRAVGLMMEDAESDAIAELRIVRGTEPRPDCVVRLLARLYYRGGAMELARDNFEQCVAQQPDSAEARFFVALSSRTPKQMRDRLNRLLETHPEYGEARAVRARVREALGDPAGAIADVLVCLHHRPDDAALWWQVADHLASAGESGPAAVALRRVIELDPGWSTAYEHLAHFHAERGEISQALERIDAAVAADSSRREELAAVRQSLERGGAASQAVNHSGDVAHDAAWSENLMTLSTDRAGPRRMQKLDVMLVLSELHAGIGPKGCRPRGPMRRSRPSATESSRTRGRWQRKCSDCSA